MAEIERVRKRREERVPEKAKREEEIALLARERAAADFQEMEKKEAEFLLGQSLIRSKIRLDEGRVKPIDILYMQLNDLDDVKAREPCEETFAGQTYRGLEALQNSIWSMMHDGTAKVVEFWEAVLRQLEVYKAMAFLKEIHGKLPNEDANIKPEQDRILAVLEKLQGQIEDDLIKIV
ncbi:cactin [Melia azedarach]|uniref:Cactin n=1 Tax=Melia azedarach TaxID=155640 RepID=A0ACC1Y279_MELAZ|nr:cactin [Melia azedarach]